MNTCKKCGRNIDDSNNMGLCNECYQNMLDRVKNAGTNNNTKNENTTSSYIGGFIAFIIIAVLVISMISTISSSSKKDAETRKQRELREFETQLKQDPSTWNKEQRKRYDDFIEWDMQNERK